MLARADLHVHGALGQMRIWSKRVSEIRQTVSKNRRIQKQKLELHLVHNSLMKLQSPALESNGSPCAQFTAQQSQGVSPPYAPPPHSTGGNLPFYAPLDKREEKLCLVKLRTECERNAVYFLSKPISLAI